LIFQNRHHSEQLQIEGGREGKKESGQQKDRGKGRADNMQIITHSTAPLKFLID
jgi:hypothetical protein